MVPQKFQSLVSRVKNAEILPLEEQLGLLKKQVSITEALLKRQMLVQQLCHYLVNGETRSASFGGCPTYAMFVRQYKVGPSKFHDRMELVEVDMVIVPDLLIEHELKVYIPSVKDPRMSTDALVSLDIPGIVQRMLKHARYAKNVSVCAFEAVLCEACAKCGGQAPVAAFDEYLDDDNGREFSIKRICGSCSQVDDIAYYSGRYAESDRQYCITDGIYR